MSLDEKYEKETKKKTILIRVTKTEKETIEKAAEKVGVKTSNFVLTNALVEAEKVLSEDK